MTMDMTCVICKKILTVEPVFETVDGKQRMVDSIPPLHCNQCGSNKFTTKIEVDPTEWIMVVGTNG